ncbi:MAG TPA: TetR/AcrR family transcriptional regulator [Gammaproteobacteria bacterium]|jgi:AcrR family transcriptional regulator|nr:TetR/AcrR family transcriptional regulator [Gammaproteobacteria bacterium]
MSTPQKQIAAISPFEPDSKCDEGACARDRIFEAAKKLFYKSGIRGVSVDAIAAEANTTKVTLYRVYESKDELIVKVLEEQAHRWSQWWDEIVAQHPGEPRTQIEALFASFRDELTSDAAERGCTMANAAVELEEDHPARRVIREHKVELGKRMRALCREMGAKNPDQLGDSLMLLFRGAFSARLLHEGREQIAVVCDAAKALLDSATLGNDTAR